MLFAIDPGKCTGWAQELNGHRSSGVWNVAAKRPSKHTNGEPRYFRLRNLWTLMQAHFATLGWPEVIVCEDAEGFTRGKSAVESAHKYRGVIELFCSLNDIRYEAVQPADIKRFATGKGNADKEAMLLAAGKLYGYRGNDDNEADAIIIREWGLRYLFKNDEHKMTA